MEISKIKKVHIIGAGGIGVSAVGKYFLHLGALVTGSDRAATPVSELLRERGANIRYPQAATNIAPGVELVVYSDAVPADNSERVRAREFGIPEMSYFEFLGELSKSYRTIAISGTHGKSTTTAMIGKILEAAGLDPLVIVGSLVPGFPDGNLRMGHGEWLVVEACEHRRHMLNFSPEIAVITNIERDHLDYYKDLDDIKSAFAQFASQSKQLIKNADDLNSTVLKGIAVSVQSPAELFAHSYELAGGVQSFSVNVGNEQLRISLALPGKHLVSDALLAFAAAREVGVHAEVIAKALAAYTGIWRRFEKIGEARGVPVYSDYAHHPTEIKVTLAAARELYPKQRLIVGFQPHQHNRTKELFDEFAHSYELADVVVIAEIFDVAGREEKDTDVSSKQLVEAIQKYNVERGSKQSVRYVETIPDLESALRAEIKPDSVIFVLGAGENDTAARNLVKKTKSLHDSIISDRI